MYTYVSTLRGGRGVFFLQRLRYIYVHIYGIIIHTYIHIHINSSWRPLGGSPVAPPLYIRSYIWYNYTDVYTHTYQLFVGAVGGFSSSA